MPVLFYEVSGTYNPVEIIRLLFIDIKGIVLIYYSVKVTCGQLNLAFKYYVFLCRNVNAYLNDPDIMLAGGEVIKLSKVSFR